MHYAAKKDSAKVGQLLLSNGAMVTVEDSSLKTPLDVARAFGSTELGVKIMLMSEPNGGRINANVAFNPHFGTNFDYDYAYYD